MYKLQYDKYFTIKKSLLKDYINIILKRQRAKQLFNTRKDYRNYGNKLNVQV